MGEGDESGVGAQCEAKVASLTRPSQPPVARPEEDEEASATGAWASVASVAAREATAMARAAWALLMSALARSRCASWGKALVVVRWTFTGQI